MRGTKAAILLTAVGLLACKGEARAEDYSGGYDTHRRPVNQDLLPGAGVLGTNQPAGAAGGVPSSYVSNYGGYSNPSTTQSSYDARVGVSGGYRQGKLDWNIAGNTSGTSPNILSELTWKNLRMYEVEGKAEYTRREGPLRGLHIDAMAYKGDIYQGDNQDSDYAGDNRTFEFSRSNNTAGGDVNGYSGAIGYAFQFAANKSTTIARFIPLVGYARIQQNMTITDGYQTVPAFGAFSGLDSRYAATWSGPFVGFDYEMLLQKAHRLHLRGEYHVVSYEGVSNWNLRSDFRHPHSFDHEADGTGYLIGLDYSYNFWKTFDLTLGGSYESWSASDGKDRTYLADGTIIDTKFNEANWESEAVSAGVRYHF
jgi:hypothetical protein